jgi:Na+/glutamate symporter
VPPGITPVIDRLMAGINLPTMIAAALLVLAVIVAIRIGKMLLMAALFGLVAGSVSLGQGHPPTQAGTHAAIGFGVAATTMILVRVARGILIWTLITAAGILGLIFTNLGPS